MDNYGSMEMGMDNYDGSIKRGMETMGKYIVEV